MFGRLPEMVANATLGTTRRGPLGLRTSPWAVLLGLALSGCATSEEPVSLDVYNWWQEKSEERAFNRVIQIHHDKHANVEINNLGEPNSDGTRAQMAAHMLAAAPPATFQANLGADLLRWTVVDARGDRDDVITDEIQSYRLIQGLSGFFEDTKLRSKLRDGLWDNLVVNGGTVPFGVPINVHRLNVLYYRPEKLAEFQSREGNAGKSFLDFDTLCPEGDYDPDASAYDLDIDIAIGVGKPGQEWTLALFTFESVLPAILARHLSEPAAVRTFYDGLFRGEMPGPREPRTMGSVYVREALECVQYLSKWFHRAPDTGTEGQKYDPDVGWAEAVHLVRNGATFTVMGDWASGLLPGELGSTPPEVVSQAFPGTDGLFVFTSDTFPLPRGAEHAAEAEDLLETLASEKAQLAFSREKGSIPAREDADLRDLHPWQRDAAEAFGRSEHLLATSGYFPTSYPQEDLREALIAMTRWNIVRTKASEEDVRQRPVLVDKALREFTDHELLLAAWQTRLRQGVASADLP
jgi:glucose/mannose transport system substrate-binding protein